MNDNEVLSDFRRRWEHTYVWLKMKHKAQETLVLVRQVEQDESKVGVLHLESADYGSITINLGSADHSLLFKYPKSGVFQHGPNAALYRRRPARQWRRGICPDNSTLTSPTRELTGTRIGIELNSLISAFKFKTYSVREALEFLNTRRARSVALAGNFSICLSPTMTSTDYLVLFWDNVVARCDSTGKITSVFEKVIEPELNGLFENGNK